MIRALTLLAVLLAGCSGATTVSTLDLDFGAVPVGSAEARYVEIADGTGDEQRYEVGVTDDAFVVDPGGLVTVPAGGSVRLRVVFAPTEEGASGGELSIARLDQGSASAPWAAVSLHGEGRGSLADEDGDGWTRFEGDCDDTRCDIHPGAREQCNGLDDDCDGRVPEREADADEDGYIACDPGADAPPPCADGEAAVLGGDCDDSDPLTHPGRPEGCDGLDSDCDGRVEDFDDADGDGLTPCAGDCDDTDPDQGDVEICFDDLDNDCSGAADDLDADGDGWSPCDVGDCDDDPDQRPIVVDPGAAGGAGCGTLELPCRSLTEGWNRLAERTSCYQLSLAPGTYAQELDASGLDLDEGATLTLQGAGADQTVLHPSASPESSGPILRWSPGEDAGGVIVRRVTLEDPGAPSCQGPGQRAVWSDTDVVLEHVVVRGFVSRGAGGAVRTATAARIDDSVFENNTACDNAGGAVRGLSVEVNRSRFAGNRSHEGGGAVTAGSMVAVDSWFRDNVAHGGDGGAARLWSAAGESRFVRTEFVSNTASSGRGGGVYGTGDLEMEDALFELNRGTHAGGLRFAGSADGVRVRVLENTATDGGAGGARLEGNGRLTNWIVQDNRAPSGWVGGLEVTGTHRVRNVTIVGNRSASGPGGFRGMGNVRLEAAIVAHNRGGAYWRNFWNQGRARHVTVFMPEGTILADPLFGQTLAPNADFHGTPPSEDAADAHLKWQSEQNRYQDPLLVRFSDDDDWTNDDLRLAPQSPSIDSGLPSNAGDRDRTRNDRGAYGGPEAWEQ